MENLLVENMDKPKLISIYISKPKKGICAKGTIDPKCKIHQVYATHKKSKDPTSSNLQLQLLAFLVTKGKMSC